MRAFPVDWLPCQSETDPHADDEPVYDEVASPNCFNGSGSGGGSARGTPNSALHHSQSQSPSPSVCGAHSRLVPLPPLPIQSDTCLGYSAGGCSDPSNDYYGSSRNSVQTVVEAANTADGEVACGLSDTADRRQMEERRRRLVELMRRCKEPGEAGAGVDSADPLYFEYEHPARGHRRVSSDPIEVGLRDPLAGKVPGQGPQRPNRLETRREEAMEIDAATTADVELVPMATEVDLSDIKALGAPPPPPAPASHAATPMTHTSATSFSAASTPTSSSSGSGSGGVVLRPRSLLRKTSVEMAQEEMENLKADIKVLRRKK